MATKTANFCLPQDVNRIRSFESLSEFDIIIDVRAYNKYIISHLKNSINICLPSTLLKRKNFDLLKMLNCVDSTPTIRQIVTSVTQSTQEKLSVLIYDTNSTDENIGFNLYYTIEKFNKYSNTFKIHYLVGGFESYIGNMDIIEYTSGTPPISPIRDHNNFSCFQLPSSTPTQEKFVSSIKKNALPKLDINSILKSSPKETNDIFTDYDYKIILPKDFNEYSDKIPPWLQILNKNNDVIINELYHNFCKIEKREHMRLKTVITQDSKCHSPSICTPRGLCPSCDEIKYVMPRGVEYGFKNRYHNIWPYEHSRVKLIDAPDDYFNANYIYNYIATQDPLQDTQEDFWNIIRANNICVIVCLNDNFGQNYYDGGNFGTIEVKIDSIEEKNGYTVRKIRLIKESLSEHIVYHLKYKEWPDFGVPKNFDSLMELISYKHKLIEDNNLNDNILVHCSAGCGRTGVFITVDYLISEIFKDDQEFWQESDPIYKLINYQRTQRISMVQNFDQFIVCYELIAHFLTQYFKKEDNRIKLGIDNK